MLKLWLIRNLWKINLFVGMVAILTVIMLMVI